MDSKPISLAIDCDSQTAQELRALFGAAEQPQFIERRNLSGDAAAWIVIATLTAKTLPHILDFIIKLAELHRVKRIKIDNIEIENPALEDLERLRARLSP